MTTGSRSEAALRLLPITLREACAFVAKHHRHHRPPQGAMFAVACGTDQVRGVAKAMDVPLVDLNALSARQAQEMGAETATKLAQEAPTPEELAAAKAGTTLPARPAPPAPPPIEGNGARGQVTRKFDYTHLGDIGAEVTARLVTQALAQAVPGLRSQLVR